MEKIYCGGFYVDDNAMEIRDGKKYLKTGAGGGAMVVNFTMDEDNNIRADKTFEDIDNAAPNVIGYIKYDETTGMALSYIGRGAKGGYGKPTYTHNFISFDATFNDEGIASLSCSKCSIDDNNNITGYGGIHDFS